MASNSNKPNLLLIGGTVVFLAVTGFLIFGNARASGDTMVVYKTPTCGCCAKWVDHLTESGFDVEVNDLDDLSSIKNIHKIPTGVRTCHTAVVGEYAVEGHVPSSFVRRLLEEKPDIAGVAVAGMPMGSPGMEGNYRASYDVLAFNSEGRTAVWGHVEGDPGR